MSREMSAAGAECVRAPTLTTSTPARASSGMPRMSHYALPQVAKPPKVGKRQVQLVASGDLRPSANEKCWPEQVKMEQALGDALAEEGYELVRAHLGIIG